jgi:GT2 family glycosyltransferase
MIILYHLDNKALNYEDTETGAFIKCSVTNIQECLHILSIKYSNTLLVWCHQSLKSYINKEKLKKLFHHQLILASYSISGDYIISKDIGFVDQHCFINVKRDVTYPTWLMSSDIGGVYSNILLKSEKLFRVKQSFSEFLCSLAKLNMPKGLLCYSEPSFLLKECKKTSLNVKKNNSTLFKFVKKHYKIQWIFILIINQFIYNKKLPLVAFFKSLFVKKQVDFSNDFSDVIIKSTKKITKKESFNIDVLIPTLGRKEHLHNVLIDLSKQTLLPKKIIIVEQNRDENSVSDLGFLKEEWPFKIDHTFTHQLGACNARNIALSKVTESWVFLADDDVRFNVSLLDKILVEINKYGTDSVVMGCLQKGEINKNEIIKQSEHFGSGTSIIKACFLKNIKFKKEHEFGYGEDNDFGMQLRGIGVEIIGVPKICMLHLKAPTGGFRHKFTPLWDNDKVKPKPSPTVIAYNLKHVTREQLKGYKTILFIKFYNRQPIKNPLSYFKSFNERWDLSIKWAKKMMENEV